MRPLPDHRPVDRQPACVWPSVGGEVVPGDDVHPDGEVFFVCPVCWEVLDGVDGRLVHVWWEELVADPAGVSGG